MRGRMSPAKSYAPPVEVGEVMVGRVVAEVVQSKHADHKPGDIVFAETGWRDYARTEGAEARKIDPARGPITHALGLRGMPGMTAYCGLLEVGHPMEGDTVVVTAAAGAVGSVVGQIARILGCRTVGITGSDAKAAHCIENFGYDVAINYQTSKDLAGDVGAAAPDGVDIFFDNAGGSVHQAVGQHFRLNARIIICGVMSQNNPLPSSKPVPYDLRLILTRRARMQGILVSDFAHHFERAETDLARWYADGKLAYEETIAEGLEAAPEAFIGLLRGENLGKQLVRVAAAED
jgi:hypothetical protein